MTMNDQPQFLIRKLTVIDGEPNIVGSRIIASFDLIAGGVTVVGCGLIEKQDGSVKATGPFGKTPQGRKVSAQITDPGLLAAVTQRAIEVYSLLTGRAPGDPRGVVPDFRP